MTCQKVRDLAPGFVLGALEDDEMRAVRDHLAACDKPHPEVRELGGVVPYLAQLVEPVEPPEALKSSILSAVRADIAERQRRDDAAERLVAAMGSGTTPARRRVVHQRTEAEESVAAPPAAQTAAPDVTEPVVADPAPAKAPEERPKVVSIAQARARRLRMARWAMAAAAAIVLVVGSLYTYSLQRQLADARAELDARASLMFGGPEDRAEVILRSPSGAATNGKGVIRSNGHLVLGLFDLPATSGGDVYVVWLVPTGSKPVAAAVVEGNSTWAQIDIDSPAVGAADQVIVTLEHSRDVTAPTTPPILMGRVV